MVKKEEQTCFPIWFAKIRKAIQRRQLEILKPYGLSSIHAMYLTMLLNNEDGMTLRELNERMFVDKANTSRAIATLEEKGYVERDENGSSKLKYRIKLTHEGAKVAQVVADDMKVVHGILHGTMTEDEILIIRNVMLKVSKAADNI